MSDPDDMNKQVITEFRANEGKVGGFFAHAELVLLHTTGAKSGKERINPLMSMHDGDEIVIIASKGGAPSNPAWYYNLVANPEVEIEFGTERFKAIATIAEEPKRTELYNKMATKHDFFVGYAQNTERVIPVVTLVRQS